MKLHKILREFEVSKDIRLREFCQTDATTLFALIDHNRSYLKEHLAWIDDQKSIEESESFIAKSQKHHELLSSLTLAVEYCGQVVGVVGFHKFDWNSRSASLGFWIDSKVQGKGIVSRSCQVLVNYVTRELGFHKVYLKAGTENIKSQKVAERLGFVKEGVNKDAEWLYDHYVDHCIYSFTYPSADDDIL